MTPWLPAPQWQAGHFLNEIRDDFIEKMLGYVVIVAKRALNSSDRERNLIPLPTNFRVKC